MTTPRSSLHMLTAHDGSRWLEDQLVEGDYVPKVRELLRGDPTQTKELLPGMSAAFYRDERAVLVMTFGPEVDRAEAERQLGQVRSGREDTN